MKTLYIDMNSGISGDMSLAGLYGLGLRFDGFIPVLKKMTGLDVELNIEQVKVSGILSNRLNIKHPHEHKHRGLKDITDMISSAELADNVKEDAIGIFEIIAEAEADVHGTTVDKIHFHEVGAIDSIIDIVGFAWGINELGIDRIVSSYPVFGCGTVKCAHGLMPVPAPATLKILEDVRCRRTEEPNELTTPTGAALLKYYVKDYSLNFDGKVIQSVFSTGTKELETIPNLLRFVLLDDACSEIIVQMETNIDDMTGESMGSLLNFLMEKGALDVFYTPTIGKKNRPAQKLTLLIRKGEEKTFAKELFSRSSTAGVRFLEIPRIIMDRDFVEADVNGEKIKVKKLTFEDIVKYCPEWDSCVAASEHTGMSADTFYVISKSILSN